MLLRARALAAAAAASTASTVAALPPAGSRPPPTARSVAPGPRPPSPPAVEDVKIRLPPNWNDDHVAWSRDAAEVLRGRGLVVLAPSEGEPGLIDGGTCDAADAAARTRLREMHRRVEGRGLDPTGRDEPYRFAEVVCRDEGGRRYDVPVPFSGGADGARVGGRVGSGRVGTPLGEAEGEAIGRLHEGIGRLARPVMDRLWPGSQGYVAGVAAAGFLINEPGSGSQGWHRDGPDEGYVDCFVPLVDLDESIGPTAIRPDTHTDAGRVDAIPGDDFLVPLLNKGDVLLFDYRTVHRGQGNRSESTTRTLAYAVYQRRQSGKAGIGGDIHNFPAALTLEYD